MPPLAAAKKKPWWKGPWWTETASKLATIFGALVVAVAVQLSDSTTTYLKHLLHIAPAPEMPKPDPVPTEQVPITVETKQAAEQAIDMGSSLDSRLQGDEQALWEALTVMECVAACAKGRDKGDCRNTAGNAFKEDMKHPPRDPDPAHPTPSAERVANVLITRYRAKGCR